MIALHNYKEEHCIKNICCIFNFSQYILSIFSIRIIIIPICWFSK
ncbi:Uncharacterized protein BM_BM13293 [Brugia malayi]|nr:Uncharacterized protein BM_BM13293 [Brugia malayi]VIO97908.1 Uncharacterized protein BM_BM13293 [Brugia malayi]